MLYFHFYIYVQDSPAKNQRFYAFKKLNWFMFVIYKNAFFIVDLIFNIKQRIMSVDPPAPALSTISEFSQSLSVSGRPDQSIFSSVLTADKP